MELRKIGIYAAVWLTNRSESVCFWEKNVFLGKKCVSGQFAVLGSILRTLLV